MVEGEKGSRQANGSSEAVSRQRRPVPDAGEGEEMPPGDLARLLAAVGVLLGSHAAADLVVVPREELERREFAAYGHGWRDAAAQYHQLAEWVEGLPVTDADNRTPGQAAVIPFRRRVARGARDEARRDGSELAGTGPAKALIRSPRPATGAADPAAREAADPTRPAPDPAAGPASATPMAPGPAAPAPGAPGPTRPGVEAPAPPSPPVPPARAGTGAAEPGSASADAARADEVRPGPAVLSRPAGPPSTSSPPSSPSTSSSPPAFASKSRRSKVPTIPRLPRPRRQGSPDGQH
ncbi:hypothetical protein ACIO3R_34575 [Streptomyces sp. NPDC087428]|uniref:hypothetical protein n=1 Tax=Streptomyces sp. NPDC087428 TaxID=3365788 RepID=UPI003816908E